MMKMKMMMMKMRLKLPFKKRYAKRFGVQIKEGVNGVSPVSPKNTLYGYVAPSDVPHSVVAPSDHILADQEYSLSPILKVIP